MTMLRSSSPAISEISVGSPSPPPPTLNIKRLKPNVEIHTSAVQFPFSLAAPQRRKSNAERVKSFSIADILGKKERVEEMSRISSPITLPNPVHSNNIPANPAVLHSNLIQERLQTGLTVPAPLIMLDIPTLQKVIPPTWDSSGNLIVQQAPNAASFTSTASVPTALPLHHLFPPALLHYEQRLAWDYQRQLQEHFQAQAQLLRQMSMDPNIIPSEDGSERSRSSSAGSHCYSPDVNVAGDDDDENEQTENEEGNKRTADNRLCATGEKNGKSTENTTKEKTKKSASDTPLDALFQLSTKNFDEDQDPATLSIFATRPNPKKKRKSRTAFTNHQIFELEKRFLYQKYLSPADRDEIAAGLGLSNAQVITWFQNRRAKLKRDMEELKKDVESVKQLSAHKSFLENVNDLSILKTRPVSRHQPPPQPPAAASAVQHHAEIHTAAHTHGNHITAAYSTTTAAATFTERRLHPEPIITVHNRSPQQHHHSQLQQHTTATALTCNERRNDNENYTESLQPQPNAAAEQQQQQQQSRNLQINHSRG